MWGGLTEARRHAGAARAVAVGPLRDAIYQVFLFLSLSERQTWDGKFDSPLVRSCAVLEKSSRRGAAEARWRMPFNYAKNFSAYLRRRQGDLPVG